MTNIENITHTYSVNVTTTGNYRVRKTWLLQRRYIEIEVVYSLIESNSIGGGFEHRTKTWARVPYMHDMRWYLSQWPKTNMRA